MDTYADRIKNLQDRISNYTGLSKPPVGRSIKYTYFIPLIAVLVLLIILKMLFNKPSYTNILVYTILIAGFVNIILFIYRRT